MTNELEKLELTIQKLETKVEGMPVDYERGLVVDYLKKIRVMVDRMKRKDRLTVIK